MFLSRQTTPTTEIESKVIYRIAISNTPIFRRSKRQSV